MRCRCSGVPTVFPPIRIARSAAKKIMEIDDDRGSGDAAPSGDPHPARSADRATGTIDPAVAAYWREHYDIAHIVARDWTRPRHEERRVGTQCVSTCNYRW